VKVYFYFFLHFLGLLNSFIAIMMNAIAIFSKDINSGSLSIEGCIFSVVDRQKPADCVVNRSDITFLFHISSSENQYSYAQPRQIDNERNIEVVCYSRSGDG